MDFSGIIIDVFFTVSSGWGLLLHSVVQKMAGVVQFTLFCPCLKEQCSSGIQIESGLSATTAVLGVGSTTYTHTTAKGTKEGRDMKSAKGKKGKTVLKFCKFSCNLEISW